MEHEMGTFTPEQLLKEVNTAINAVLIGGQAYKIGSRQLTRADLGMLRQLKKDLETEVSREPDGLLGNTVVAVFDGR